MEVTHVEGEYGELPIGNTVCIQRGQEVGKYRIEDTNSKCQTR